MFKFFVCSAVFAVANCRPGIVFSSYHGLGGSSAEASGGLEGWSEGGGGGGSGGGDFHHGVSLVGGGGGKPHTIDLTGHGDKHEGHFGGSFVASSKYSAGGHEGGGEGGHEGGGFEAHYSDVLGAGEDHSGAESAYEVHELSALHGHYY